MKKHTIRKEFFKLKNKRLSYKQCQRELEINLGVRYSIITLKRWKKKLHTEEWDLNDKSTRPQIIHYKFSKDDKKEAVDLRKKTGYSSKQIRIKLQEKEIIMSESYIKQLVKGSGLSRGNKIEGTRLK